MFTGAINDTEVFDKKKRVKFPSERGLLENSRTMKYSLPNPNSDAIKHDE